MKFKVGDMVRVREDLEPGCEYGSKAFVTYMCGYRGAKATIKKVYKGYYTLEEDTECYHWTDEMLEDYVLGSTNEITIKKLQEELNKLKIQNAYLLGKLVAYEEKSNNKEEN